MLKTDNLVVLVYLLIPGSIILALWDPNILALTLILALYYPVYGTLPMPPWVHPLLHPARHGQRTRRPGYS